jgi:hypothetical protein
MHTPDISDEMAELLRRYSNLRNSNVHKSSLRAISKDLKPGQNTVCLPAPVRFIRKSKLPKGINVGSSARGQFTRNESPRPSAHNKASLVSSDDPYDDLLERLMSGCELNHDPHQSTPGAATMDNLDAAQLNEPR